jgi:two-component system, sensor histidine kinase LadS
MNIIHNENLEKSKLEAMYKNDNLCLEYLSQLKWAEGFTCKRCNNDNFCDGKVPYSRRCTRCKNEESATANTLFHNIKFPVSKAFYIAYEIFGNKKLSTFEVSQSLGIRQMTCWNFKNKVEDRLIRLVNTSGSEKLLITDILVKEIESPFK